MKLAICLFVFLCFFGAMCQNVEKYQQQEQKIYASRNITTSAVFPRHNSMKVPAGEVVELLLGFKNIGDKAVNVTYIRSNLLFNYDKSVIKNFTTFAYGDVVMPGEEATFSYSFYIDQMVQPSNYGFISAVYYYDEQYQNYTTVFFNGTIDVIEAERDIDVSNFFGLVFLAGIIAIAGYVYIQTKQGKGVVSMGRSTTNDSDWTKHTLAGQHKNKKAKKRNN
eukprot:TRINITY_DN10100_c0_g1_i1.p1 TRINITY_DN10100_c0_g1~~TRINITY_DN10100_c0_g1_i1.p1  ORF type:complete len:222 (-),score=41.95 TRINITY_DN10100_c0_g1_i1:22-687(-)